jgi:hypothetical protein
MPCTSAKRICAAIFVGAAAKKKAPAFRQGQGDVVAPTPHSGGCRPPGGLRERSARGNAYRDSRSRQKRRPQDPCGLGPKFCVLGRMGDDPGLSMSDAPASDCRSIFCEVMADTKRRKLRQQSRRPLGSQRLCLVPHTCRFLGQQSLGAEPARRRCGERLLHLPSPHFRSAKRGTASPTRKDYRSHGGFFAASQGRQTFAWGKDRPRRQCIEARVLNPTIIWGRAAIALPDPVESEAAARQSRDQVCSTALRQD